MPADGAQEGERLAGGEIADRRARIEERRRQVREIGLEIEPDGEVGDDTQPFDAGMLGGEARERTVDGAGGDVHRDVALRRHVRKPVRALGTVAGTEVDELAAPADRPRDVVAALAEDRPLGAGGVILGQLADRGEQRAAQGVVEVFRRDAGGCRTQPGDERAPFGDGVDFEAMDEAMGGRHDAGSNGDPFRG